MSKNIAKIPFDRIYEALMKLAIENPASKKLFMEWERLHLRDLTSSNKGYKRSSKSSFKAKVLKSLPESTQRSLFEKLAPSYNLESAPTQEQLLEFQKSLAIDFLLGETLKTLNDHSLRFLALYPGFLQNVHDDLAEIDYAQKSHEFAGIALVKASDVVMPESEAPVAVEPVETTLAVAADKLIDLALEGGGLDGLDNSGVNFARALAAISKQSTSLGQLITNALTLDTDAETMRALKSEIDFQLSETVPRGLDTYRVVLTDIFELPNSAGYAGKACAVETAGGKLIPISEKVALETFPTRGGVYIPMSAITASASKSTYLPMVAIKSSHEGVNHYRMKSLWADLDQIIDLNYGLDRYDDLVEEIKSLSLPDIRIATWFRLQDGSLIAPASQRSTFTLQAFSEKWRFIAAEVAAKITTVYGLASSSEFSGATNVSMAPISKVLSEIERLTSENLPIPDYLVPRTTAVTKSLNSIVSLDDFTRGLVIALKSKKPLANEYQALLETEIRRNAPELEDLKKQREDTRSELEALEKKLSAAASRLEGVEGTLKSKASEMVKKFKTDLSPILNDPILLAVINEFHGYAVPPATQEFANLEKNNLDKCAHKKTPSTAVQFNPEQQKHLLKGLGIKTWSEECVEKFTAAANDMMRCGLALEVHGEHGFQLAHLILGHHGDGKYETVVSTFAENIDYACSRLLQAGDSAMLITGVEERHVGLFKSALQFRAEIFSSDCAPVIFVTDAQTMNSIKSVIPVNPLEMINVSASGEYDEEDFESDLPELGTFFRKHIKGMEPSGFLDLVYLSNTTIIDDSD